MFAFPSLQVKDRCKVNAEFDMQVIGEGFEVVAVVAEGMSLRVLLRKLLKLDCLNILARERLFVSFPIPWYEKLLY